MTLRFGTDGVRGVANSELSPDLALAVGRAAARVIGTGPWVIGRDPRRSGDLITAALGAGLMAEGVEVIDLGIAPTPAVAHVAAVRGIAAAMISASHNPFGDNGIKLFAPGGRKLSDETERAIEAELGRVRTGAVDPKGVPTGTSVGHLTPDPTALDAYRTHLVETVLDGTGLDGLRIVLDTANGAASSIAPDVFAHLGATVTTIHDRPDGVNINDGCGSTRPDDLAEKVTATGADLGLAFDGDADRVLAIDHTGRLVDGDQILAIAAIDLHEQGRLPGDTVVVTVMSNLGFRQGMAARGIRVIDTAVGDRHVLEALDTGGYALGGEQSGHLIFRELATTGDGILSGILLADLIRRRDRSLADLTAAAMTRLPQVLVNVRLDRRDPDLLEAVAPAVREAEEQLGERGRVLLRASGTEPLMRVMVEAPTDDEARHIAGNLAAAVRATA